MSESNSAYNFHPFPFLNVFSKYSVQVFPVCVNDAPLPLKPLMEILINRISHEGLNWPTVARASDLPSSHHIISDQ